MAILLKANNTHKVYAAEQTTHLNHCPVEAGSGTPQRLQCLSVDLHKQKPHQATWLQAIQPVFKSRDNNTQMPKPKGTKKIWGTSGGQSSMPMVPMDS